MDELLVAAYQVLILFYSAYVAEDTSVAEIKCARTYSGSSSSSRASVAYCIPSYIIATSQDQELPRSKYIHASCKSSKFGCFHLLLLSPVVKIPTKTKCLSLGGRPYSDEAVLANLKTVQKWDGYAYFRPRPCPYVPFLVIVHDKLLDLPVRDQSRSLGFRAPTETVMYLLVSTF